MKKLLLAIYTMGSAALTYAQSPAQIPNSGMENWSSNSTLNEPVEPTGWFSENIFCSPALHPTDPVSVTKYTPAFAGNFSAQIKTVVIPSSGNLNYPTIPDTLGELVLGTVQFSSPYLFPGAAYTSKPMTLSFESMYTPVGSDSAYAVIQLSKWTTSRQIISFNTYRIPPSGVFTPNTFNLTYLISTLFPDTINIAFTSSANNRHNARGGSILVIDGLNLTGTVGIEEYQNNVHFSTYPNPANTELNITTDASLVDHMNICDLSGRVIASMHVSADHTVINTSTYPAGMYVFNAISKEGVIQARGKFSVTR
jgi:hypothetical protein